MFFSWQLCGFSNNHSHAWYTSEYNWQSGSLKRMFTTWLSLVYARSNHIFKSGFHKATAILIIREWSVISPWISGKTHHSLFPHRLQSRQRDWRSCTGERKGRIWQRFCTQWHLTWWQTVKRQWSLRWEEGDRQRFCQTGGRGWALSSWAPSTGREKNNFLRDRCRSPSETCCNFVVHTGHFEWFTGKQRSFKPLFSCTSLQNYFRTAVSPLLLCSPLKLSHRWDEFKDKLNRKCLSKVVGPPQVTTSVHFGIKFLKLYWGDENNFSETGKKQGQGQQKLYCPEGQFV